MIQKRKFELPTEAQKMIDKGGHVPSDLKSKPMWTTFNLRIKKSMLDEIDEALEETVGISKTGWVLQAIQEKLRKHKDANPNS